MRPPRGDDYERAMVILGMLVDEREALTLEDIRGPMGRLMTDAQVYDRIAEMTHNGHLEPAFAEARVGRTVGEIGLKWIINHIAPLDGPDQKLHAAMRAHGIDIDHAIQTARMRLAALPKPTKPKIQDDGL